MSKNILVNCDKSLIEFAHKNPITIDEIKQTNIKKSMIFDFFKKIFRF